MINYSIYKKLDGTRWSDLTSFSLNRAVSFAVPIEERSMYVLNDTNMLPFKLHCICIEKLKVPSGSGHILLLLSINQLSGPSKFHCFESVQK